MRRHRIGFLIHELDLGGTESHLVEVLRRLDRNAFEPHVFCLRRPGQLGLQVRELGISLIALGIERIYGPHALRSARRLGGLLRERRIELLHTYLISSNIYGTLVGRLAGVRRLVTSRRDMGFSRNWRLALVETGLVNRLADRIVVVCEALREQVLLEPGTSPSKVVTIANGLDLTRWAARPPDPAVRAGLGLAPHEAVVGIVGVLAPIKGHRYFLEAARLVAASRPHVRFLVVGDGPLRQECEQQARVLRIADRTIFTGRQDRSADLLGAMDVVVCSSLSEGMSMSLLEAMALARPVVATRVGGNPEVVADGESGRLVPAADGAALAEAIGMLVDAPELAARLGKEGRRRVETLFDVDSMVRRMESLYRELLHGVAVPAPAAVTS